MAYEIDAEEKSLIVSDYEKACEIMSEIEFIIDGKVEYDFFVPIE